MNLLTKLEILGVNLVVVLFCIFVSTASTRAFLTCNDIVTFEEGTSEGYIHIVNSSRMAVQAELVLKGSDAVIYSSEMIPGGGFVENIKLNVDAPAGTYECKMVFKGLGYLGQVKTWDTEVVYIKVEK